MGINLITQAIIPRALGPVAYGSFDFLTTYFSKIIGFLDSGTSFCFYTRLSQNIKKTTLIVFYMYYAVFVLMAMMAFVSIVICGGYRDLFWPEQAVLYIMLAAGWAFLAWLVNNVLNGMADAYGLTVYSEKARVVQKLFGIGLIFVLFFLQQLTLLSFFLYHYVILFFLAGTLFWIFHKKGLSIFRSQKPTNGEIKGYSSDFYRYAYPFLIVGVLSLLAGIFDRWLLQIYGGSVEQGFYGLSYQLGGICILFTSAIVPLLMREFAIAHGDNNIDEMARLFHRYFPLLYSVSAYFSCFIALNASKVVYIFGGDKFSGAVMALTIMAFYPIHQTYGQLSSSIFYATGQTRVYGNISLIFTLLGLPLTYYLIAPVGKMGIEAGATGLAIKMVVLNIIGVNVQLFYNARFLKISYWQCLTHQIKSVAFFLGISVCAIYCSDQLLAMHDQMIISFLISGILYSTIVVLLGFGFPFLLGMDRKDVVSFVHLVRSKMRGPRD